MQKSQQTSDLQIRACMGGWCEGRQECPHYHSVNRKRPSENLCAERERDEAEGDFPRVVHWKPAGTWERKARQVLRAAEPFDALA